ncbi:MAG: TIR domain-containing protein [Acetobacteraceae bacterium]
MNRKPRLFIGSSFDGLEVARALQAELEDRVDVVLWTQGVFEMKFACLESLIQETDKADFAVLVLTAEDMIRSRGRQRASPRDNVLFELGLFMGRLGRQRCFFLHDGPERDGLTLPADLLGVWAASYVRRADGDLRSAIGPAAMRMAEQVDAIGPRPRIIQSPLQNDAETESEPAISGTWAGFAPGGDRPDEPVSTMTLERHGAFVRAFVERRVRGGVRRYSYEGRFLAGQLVLFYEDDDGGEMVVGTMVLHLGTDQRTLAGKSTYYQNETGQVVTTDRIYRRMDQPRQPTGIGTAGFVAPRIRLARSA